MRIFLTLLFSMFIATNYSCESTAPGESTIMKEEADVYAAYINKYYITKPWAEFKNKPFDKIVIFEMTAVLQKHYYEKISKLPAKPDEDTVKHFIERNGPPMSESEESLAFIGRYPLNPLIKFDLSHTLISKDEGNRIFNEGAFEAFYNKYPTSRGLVRFSRAGFNKNMDQALLYFAQEYSPEGGEGFLVLLEKKDGEWDTVARVTVWVS